MSGLDCLLILGFPVSGIEGLAGFADNGIGLAGLVLFCEDSLGLMAFSSALEAAGLVFLRWALKSILSPPSTKLYKLTTV